MRSQGRSRRRAAVRALALAGLIATLAVSGAHAASVTVRVVERDGGPVVDQVVDLVPERTDEPRWFASRRVGRTDHTGRTGFDELATGTYSVGLGRIADPALVPPRRNPYAEPTAITLDDPAAAVEVTIELWRGVPLSVEADMLDSDLLRGTFVIRHVETGFAMTAGFSANAPSSLAFDEPVVPGRWRVELDMPPGFLVPDVVVNRESVTGPAAQLDTATDRRPQWVTWRVSAPCEMTGTVTAEGGGPASGITVAARPLAPGDWVESEARRGRRHDQVRAHETFRGRYRMGLPPGRWRLEPVGDGLASSEPPFVDVDLIAGQVLDASFAVEVEDTPDGDGITLVAAAVAEGDGAPVVDVVAAVWRAGEVGSRPPVRRGRSDESVRSRYTSGRVRFEGMKPGTYEVVVGHPDWLDGSATVTLEDDPARRWYSVDVELPRGSTVAVRAFDVEEDRDEPGVEVRLERLGDPPPSPLDDETLARQRMRRVVRTDATGRAALGGLWPGDYRLTARVTGELARRRFARVALSGSGDAGDELDLAVAGAEPFDVDVLVSDGAVISGTLRCDDGGPLPRAASFRVYTPATGASPPAPRMNEPSSGEPDLALDDAPLEGRDQDDFAIGPLERGTYVAAVRPIGHEAWAWMYGADLVDDAAVLDVPEGEITGVGAIDAVCAPRLVLSPLVEDGAAPPDLGEGTVELEAVVRNQVGDELAVDPLVEPRGDHVMVSRLREGVADVSVVLEHPYLVPPRASVGRQALALERGAVATVHVPFSTVGGAIHVAGGGVAVCLWSPGLDDAPRRSEPSDAAADAVFPGIVAGEYVVGRCDGGRRAGVSVAVERRRTRRIDLSP